MITITAEEIEYLYENLFNSLSDRECEVIGVFRHHETISLYEVQDITRWSYSKCHRTMKGLEQKHLLSSYLKPSEKSGLKRIYSLSNLGRYLIKSVLVPEVA
ncbi:MAG TPA: hypothetical protein PK955_00800 [Methanoregulaceae archaeon]|nr:hypothetical protein [Methanoregulaceae archaeon]